jgi:hypothetical protein
MAHLIVSATLEEVDLNADSLSASSDIFILLLPENIKESGL